MTMTKAWAVELAPQGLNVNAIAPGTVETPMNDALRDNPDFDRLTRGATPQGRNGQSRRHHPGGRLSRKRRREVVQRLDRRRRRGLARLS